MINIRLYKTFEGIIIHDTMNQGNLCEKHPGELKHIGTILSEGDTTICNFGFGQLISYREWSEPQKTKE